MSQSPTRRSPLPPTFSTLHAIQDSVLVCSKKDGNVENFDYVPLQNVKLGGKPLGEVFVEIETYLDETNSKMKQLEETVSSVSERMTQLAKILQGGTE